MAAEVLEELYLAQGSLGKDLFAEYVGDFLDGNAFASLSVCCGTTRDGRQFHHTTLGSHFHHDSKVADLPDDTVGTLA